MKGNTLTTHRSDLPFSSYAVSISHPYNWATVDQIDLKLASFDAYLCIIWFSCSRLYEGLIYLIAYSDAYTETQLNISWREIDPIIMNADLKLPDMHIVSYHAQVCDGTYAVGKTSLLSHSIFRGLYTYVRCMYSLSIVSTFRVLSELVLLKVLII